MRLDIVKLLYELLHSPRLEDLRTQILIIGNITTIVGLHKIQLDIFHCFTLGQMGGSRCPKKLPIASPHQRFGEASSILNVDSSPTSTAPPISYCGIAMLNQSPGTITHGFRAGVWLS